MGVNIMENCIELQAMVDEYFKTKSLKLRNDIIEESFMLICKRAKDRYERGSLDVDDIIQNSVVMLIARLDKYESSRAAFTSSLTLQTKRFRTLLSSTITISLQQTTHYITKLKSKFALKMQAAK